jgi:hypothetical protein
MGQREPKRYERSGTHLHLSNGYEKIIIIIIFKPISPLFLYILNSRLVKLGTKMTRSREKGAQELRVFAHN